MTNKDQLAEETTYPHLAEFLRSGGTMEVGKDPSTGTFAKITKHSRTIAIHCVYRDFEAVLKEMNSAAREHFSEAPANNS